MGRRNDNRPLAERGSLSLNMALVAAGCAFGLGLAAGWNATGTLALYLGSMSLATLVLFAIDKRRAAAGTRRVSEANLLAASFLGGAAGGLAGVFLVRHKSHRWTFRFLVPLFLLAQIAGLVVLASR